MKPLKIKRYIHDVQKDKLKSITTNKVDIKSLEHRLAILETELKQTLQKLAQYQTIISTTSTSQSIIQSNFSHLKQIKDYLLWIINQLNTHTNSEITSEQQKYITNIDNLLTGYTTENTDSIMTLRTRSGRSGEHIDVKDSCFDYGTYLESGLHHYRFLFQGSGLQFEPDELLANLHQKKATFANYITLAVFGCYNQYHYDNVQFQSIFKMVYGQACKLMYQSFNQIGFDTLRMLMLCNEIACNEGDIKIIRKLFPIAVRMAYALQLDQAHLLQLETSSKSENELIIKKWKVWNSIAIFYFTNQEFLMDKCLKVQLNEYNLKLNSLYQLNDRYNDDLNYTASLIRLHIQEMLLIICSNINHELTAQYNLNQEKYNIERIQVILSNYFVPSVNYLDHQLKLKYKVKSLDNYLCYFKGTTTDSLIYYHSIKNSLLIYTIQIYIITPGIITAPTPDFVTDKNVLILIEVAIKIHTVYSIITYNYFQQVVNRLNSHSKTNSLIRNIQLYLNRQQNSIPTRLSVHLTQLIFKTIQLDSLLHAFHIFLIAISVKEYQLNSLFSLEKIQYFQHCILEIISIIQLLVDLQDTQSTFNMAPIYVTIKKSIAKFELSDEFTKEIQYKFNLDTPPTQSHPLVAMESTCRTLEPYQSHE